MVEGLLARKLGMVQLFDKEGKLVAGTIMEAGPCTVVRLKDDESRNCRVVQLGFQDVVERKLTKPVAGHFRKVGVLPKKYLKDVKIDPGDEYKVGQEIRADVFSAGQRVDVTGISKGKGFAGVVRRWHMAGGPASHGSMSHRRVGSVGSNTWPGRVMRGKRMPGHAGNRQVSVLNLEVLQVRPADNLILVRGAVPGPEKGIVFVRRSVKKKVKRVQ